MAQQRWNVWFLYRKIVIDRDPGSNALTWMHPYTSGQQMHNQGKYFRVPYV